MKLSVLRIAAIMSVLLLTANCKESKTKIVRQTIEVGQSDGGGISGAPTPQGHTEGTASGGGSLGDESGDYILDFAARDLYEKLRPTSREIIANFPDNWDIEKFRSVIKNVRRSKSKSVERHGTDLMLNYGFDQETNEPYIEALNWYYQSYASTNINHMSREAFGVAIAEIQLKLLHEAAHLLGIGTANSDDPDARAIDQRARDFAETTVRSLGRNHALCRSTSPIPNDKMWLRSRRVLSDQFKCQDLQVDRAMVEGAHSQVHPESRDELKRILQRSFTEQSYLNFQHSYGFEVLMDLGSGKAVAPKATGTDRLVGEFAWLKGDTEFFGDEFLRSYEDIMTEINSLFWELPKSKRRIGLSRDLVMSLGNLDIGGRHPRGRSQDFVLTRIDMQPETEVEASEFKFNLSLNDLNVTRQDVVPYLREGDFEDGPFSFSEGRVRDRFGNEVDLSMGLTMVRVYIGSLNESIQLNIDNQSATMSVSQQAEVVCDDGETLPLNEEFSFEMDCDLHEIEPVFVSDYLEK